MIPPGVHLQIYFDAIDGSTTAAKVASLASELAEWAAMGVAGVIPHGLPAGLPASYDAIADVVRTGGLPCGVAMGLDEDAVTAGAKGSALGTLAARQGCYVALVDCETHFEKSPTGREEMRELGAAFRARAPDALCIAQPWPEPLKHPTFPYEEENGFVDANAYQAYYNAWRSSLGGSRYATLGPLFRAQWAALETSRLQACPRPTLLTIEGYGWDDVPWDCVSCLLANPSVIVWCDPFPTATVKRAVRSVAALASSGFSGADAVRAFQEDARARGTYEGAIDGKCGPETMRALGVL
jgi:hypothetical protein